jgi:hypothetical protein
MDRAMSRLVPIVLLIPGLLVSGCAQHEPLFPPGQSHEEVVAAIEQRGEGVSPSAEREPKVADHRFLAVAGEVLEDALLVAVALCFWWCLDWAADSPHNAANYVNADPR